MAHRDSISFMEKHPLHLKIPDLQTSPEVDRAVEQKERIAELEGENLKIPNNPNERIEVYMERLERLILDPENEQEKKDLGDTLHTRRPRALSLLREMVINEYITPNKEKMAEGAAMVEERAARQMGIQAEYGPEQLEQRADIAVGDLESSIDQWITYLSDKNEPYPTWFRYYVFRNILNLSEFDKTKQEFPKRSKGTFKLFPEVDRGALAHIQETMESAQDDEVLNRVRKSQKDLWQTPDSDLLTKEKAQAFAKLSFANQYAEAIKQNGDISPELREETKGEWVHYQQGTDPTALWMSLQNKGTAWCTRGFPTAKTQLDGGDFYVYYTLDATGQPKIPRIAIRMDGQNKIAENPRGVFDAQQNLEPNMTSILETKLKEFGHEADKYKQKTEDMKMMTEIEKKIQKNITLTKQELIFLYEIDHKIEGFGYQRDPRIEEIRSNRDPLSDAPFIFECKPEEIASSRESINGNTKAYIGSWTPEVYKVLPKSVSHIYEKFPDSPIFRKTIETDQNIQTPEQAKKALLDSGNKISGNAEDMFGKVSFSKEGTKYNLVEFSVGQLGFTNGAKLSEIYEKAKELGLELCPAEAGPLLRLQYTNQQDSNCLGIAMEPIADRDGDPSLFYVFRDFGESWLSSAGGRLDREWLAGSRFVFLSRK